MGGRGQTSTSYQGRNLGSGRAHSEGTVLETRERIDRMLDTYSKVGIGQDEAIRQIRKIASPNDDVRIYRATVGDTINGGDWIFLDEFSANRWAHQTFHPDRPKVGADGRPFKVVAATVKAKDVGWTGKNLEFVYTGRRRVG